MATEVIIPVMVVELSALPGIFIKLLFMRMKNNLERKANPAPRMKCQSISNFKIPIGVRFEPLINEREPVSKIDITVTREKSMV